MPRRARLRPVSAVRACAPKREGLQEEANYLAALEVLGNSDPAGWSIVLQKEQAPGRTLEPLRALRPWSFCGTPLWGPC